MTTETISEKLEKYFFNMTNEQYGDDHHKLLELLTLETNECDELFQKNPRLFDQYLNTTIVNEPNTESEKESNEPINTKAVKIENSEDDSDMEYEATPSYRPYRRRNSSYEFKMPMHKGIPNSSTGPTSINVLNIDCIIDLDLREIIIKKWVTEISLIIQTNPEEFNKAKNVLLLIEHKTDGIIQKFLKNHTWNEDIHGSDLFDTLVDYLYTTFIGLDYYTSKDEAINKKVEKARAALTKLQLHDICFLDKYTCTYEKYLYEITRLEEYPQWVSAYLMKIPIIGESCSERWKKEAITDIQKNSLALATKIAKEEINRICLERYKQRKLKTISKSCCSILSDINELDIGKKTYTGSRKKHKKKYKKKYKPFWKKKKRRFSPGKYFRKPSKDLPTKNSTCPQGKKKCRCWICNEEGHYANECPNRKKYPDKLKVLITANTEGYEALEEEYEGLRNVFLYQESNDSSSSSDNEESTTDDSDSN